MPARCTFCTDAPSTLRRGITCCSVCAGLIDDGRLNDLADRALVVPGASERLSELRELFRRLSGRRW